MKFDGNKVSQRLMVQGYSGHASYNGGLDVARKILKSEGIRGLYRGFSLSVLTYSPSSAVWWASYGSSQRFIWRLDDDDDLSKFIKSGPCPFSPIHSLVIPLTWVASASIVVLQTLYDLSIACVYQQALG